MGIRIRYLGHLTIRFAEWQENTAINLVICINTQSVKHSMENKRRKNNVPSNHYSFAVWRPTENFLLINIFFKYHSGDFMGYNSLKDHPFKCPLFSNI